MSSPTRSTGPSDSVAGVRAAAATLADNDDITAPPSVNPTAPVPARLKDFRRFVRIRLPPFVGDILLTWVGMIVASECASITNRAIAHCQAGLLMFCREPSIDAIVPQASSLRQRFGADPADW